MSSKTEIEQIKRSAVYERAVSSDALFEQITERIPELSDRKLSALVDIIKKEQIDRESTRIIDGVI